jgi:glucose-1-phosphate cytidylyltransferase
MGLTTMILCGGLGTRLREETEYRPKAMVEIGGRPILWHIMNLYAFHGHRDFVLCLGYKGDRIKDYFLNYEAHQSDFTIELGRSRSITYHDSHAEAGWRVTLAETGLMTQSGARIKRASRYVCGDRFLLTYGDGVSNVDITALLAFHRQHGKLATVTGIVPISRFGELLADGDSVVKFNEKARAQDGLVSGGFFVFERAALEYLTDEETCVLERQPLERLASDGQLAVYRHRGFWQCMDTYRDVQHLNQLWDKGQPPWKVWE